MLDTHNLVLSGPNDLEALPLLAAAFHAQGRLPEALAGHAVALALQLPTCFEMRTLSGGLVRSAPE